jgi:hypothetical protein
VLLKSLLLQVFPTFLASLLLLAFLPLLAYLLLLAFPPRCLHPLFIGFSTDSGVPAVGWRSLMFQLSLVLLLINLLLFFVPLLFPPLDPSWRESPLLVMSFLLLLTVLLLVMLPMFLRPYYTSVLLLFHETVMKGATSSQPHVKVTQVFPIQVK